MFQLLTIAGSRVSVRVCFAIFAMEVIWSPSFAAKLLEKSSFNSSFARLPVTACHWQIFSSAPYDNPAFPDSNATYLRSGFPAVGTRLDRQILRIRGRVDGTRYASFTVYDSVSNAVRAHIADKDMNLDSGRYEIIIGTRAAIDAFKQSEYLDDERPIQQDANSSPVFRNFLYIELAGKNEVGTDFEVWHRNYLGDIHAGTVPALEIVRLDGGGDELFDGSSPHQQTLSCPPALRRPNVRLSALATIPPLNHGHAMRFFRGSGELMYPNPDNVYLVSRVNDLAGDVATIWFRPPPFGLARYWSVCLGGMSTTTSNCLYDREILTANGLDPDAEPGTYVRVMFGNEGWRGLAAQRKAAFLRWGSHKYQVIIYRNLLVAPGHPGNLSLVPPVSGGGIFGCTAFCDGWDRDSADKFIGDWAPVGWHE